jgi:hypothetical protein
MKPTLIPLIIAALSAPTFAQLNDAPPVDLRVLMSGLKQFKEQNEAGVKARRNNAYKQIVAAAASNEAAAEFWKNAVLAVQFAGVDHQATAVKDWMKAEGEGLKTKEAANAARLHLVWLGLTIQHSAGAETKQLLPTIIDFTRQIEADSAAVDKLSDHIDKLKGAPGPKKPTTGTGKALSEETHGKKLHDNILKTAVANSPVAQWLQIAEILGESGRKRKRGDDGGDGGWEPVPGNVGGIFTAIILPEFRETKDPRILEYWDLMLRKNQESLYAGMPAFEERQKTQVEKPRIMWDRTQDMLIIGLKNRALTEMFNLIKAYPQHPDSATWINKLEQIATPAPSLDPSGLGNGSVAPPRTVPPATAAPGTPPTAIIVPAAPAPPR